jgi:hypothetical protein
MVALAAAAAVAWTGCEHRPRVRPKAIVIACADANFAIDHIRWSSWTRTRAVGTGTAHENNCKPNCAAGRFHSFPITVRLSKVAHCVAGRAEFARIAWSGRRNGSETLTCAFLRLKP